MKSSNIQKIVCCSIVLFSSCSLSHAAGNGAGAAQQLVQAALVAAVLNPIDHAQLGLQQRDIPATEVTANPQEDLNKSRKGRKKLKQELASTTPQADHRNNNQRHQYSNVQQRKFNGAQTQKNRTGNK